MCGGRRSAQPTHVFTHHPQDDHRDHRATAFFANRAIEVAWAHARLARRPDLFAMLGYYVRLRWPPRGDSFVTPEVEQYPFGLELAQFELRRDELRRKKEACQTSVPTLSQAYIDSYMKKDEAFWRA